jgi:UDP-N-acetylmuramate dehydrogenase
VASSRAVQERTNIPLAELTTLRLGGPAQRLIEATHEKEVIEALAEADDSVLVIAGGSNLVIADGGYDGTVVRVATRGVSFAPDADSVLVEVSAGEPWDEVVARCVEEGLAGIECLSGIPGSAGATPIQNVGAYGQQVASTIACVRAYDRERQQVVQLAPEQCGFSYRSSAFKHTDRHVVLGVTFRLECSRTASAIRYGELSRALDAAPDTRPPLTDVREAVLTLRRGKGMVIDHEDPDSVSAGSFFVNPVLRAEEFDALRGRTDEDQQPPAWPESGGQVKTSAAWLIEQAGFHRGYGEGNVGISTKHTLALINRGGGTTGELLALAREIRDGVAERFGVLLRPEPTLVGVTL